jgi:hypothetical protein
MVLKVTNCSAGAIAGRCSHHAQLPCRIVRARIAEAGRFVLFATEAAHDTVALDRLGHDVGQVAHRDLDLSALLAELAAGTAHHEADDRQDRDHQEGESPVHPQQVAEKEDDRHSFANDDLDCVGRGAGDHGHVIGDAGNQMSRVVLIEVRVWQPQQAVEQRPPQVVDEAQRYPGQVIAAEKGTEALPGDGEKEQQGDGVDQFELAEQRQRVLRASLGRVESIDEVLEDGGEHGL